MNQAQFRFSKDILLRLGEELNPSPHQSILELVKNSYDADARDCTIEFSYTDDPGGSIRITDNGEGMDDSDIINGWLVLGRSLKSSQELTRLGRRTVGTKGLGRLAALRMGSNVQLKCRPLKNPTCEYQLSINWEEYEKADLVDDVLLSITQNKAAKEKGPGTEIVIENLRWSISGTEVRNLARALILLADPFEDNPEGFYPVLKTPEFGDLEKLVSNRYYNDAEYHLMAELDINGRASATVFDFRGETLFRTEHEILKRNNNGSPYNCPPSKFDLWVFILNRVTFSTRSSTLSEVRNWLKEIGGVHLYQNGLRVAPYGNPGNDWLEINLRRAQSPEERPSTNTSIGRVSITDIENQLIQKTDRSGFIESEEFFELKQFAVDALEWMARKRLEVAEKRRKKERTKAPRDTKTAKRKVNEAIEKVSKDSKDEVEKAFKQYDKVREKEMSGLRKEVQLYRTLSTAGITASIFAHESAGNPIKVIFNSIKTIQRRGRKLLDNLYVKTIREPVDLIIKSIDALSVLGNVTLSLIDHEKRRTGRVNVHQVIKTTLKMYKPFLKDREVKIIGEYALTNPIILGSEAAIESIITNFLNNSMTWFAGIQNIERKIVIQTEIVNNTLTLRFMDNGPGIEGISKEDIWLPGQTTRPNGSGLGLTIVQDAIKDLGGEVDVVEHGELGGAEFIVQLPLLEE